MRTYYLCLHASDFSKVGNVWTSSVIDLYDNNSYTNYSVLKSSKGQNTFRNNTWTGNVFLDSSTPNYTKTDTGFIRSNRYIDTSGSIGILGYAAVFSNKSGTGEIAAALDFYSFPNTTSSYLDEWQHLSYEAGDNDLFIADTDRYVKFIFTLTPEDSSLTFDATFYFYVVINDPVLTPLFDRTKTVLNQFPSWMKLSQIGTSVATPSFSYPESLGGRVLNAVAGEWLDDLYSKVSYLQLQKDINTLDLNQPAWAYRTQYNGDYLLSIIGDGVVLAQAGALDEFLDALRWGEDVYLKSRDQSIIFVGKNYTNLATSDGTTLRLEPFQIWNYLDEIGLMLDLTRLQLESNESYKTRILDVYINGFGVGVEKFKFALRRELDLWRAYGSTPNSYFAGATPELLELNDLVDDLTYTTADGLPTQKFQSLVSKLIRKYPFGWNYFRFGEAKYDIVGRQWEGLSYLPNQFDATPGSTPSFQAGVGDYNDLFVHRPDAITGAYNFRTRLKARGKYRNSTIIYPNVQYQVNVYGQANKYIYDNPTVTYWFTIEVHQGANAYVYSFQLSSQSDVDIINPIPTPHSYGVLHFFDPLGYISPDIAWINKATGADVEDSVADALHASNIDYLLLQPGKWDVTANNYISKPTANDFKAWFGYDDDRYLNYARLTSATPMLPVQVNAEPMYDEFYTAEDNQVLGTLSPDLWTIQSGEWEAINSYAYSVTTGSKCIATVDASSANHIVQLTLAADLSCSGVVFRFIDEGNYWYVAYNKLTNVWSVVKVVATASTTVASWGGGSYTNAHKAFSQIKVICYGSTIQIALTPNTNDDNDIDNPNSNFVIVRTITSSNNIEGTLVGIINLGLDNTDRFDRFEVIGRNAGEMLLSATSSQRSLGKWYSIPYTYSVNLNGKIPGFTTQNFTMRGPKIYWDPQIDSNPNKQYVIELVTLDAEGAGGAVTNDGNGDSFFLPQSYLTFNGSNSWSGNKQIVSYSDATPLWTFATQNGALYPVAGYFWTALSATSTPIYSGTVDEAGPWHSEASSALHDTNFEFKRINPTRAMFNVPETEDYMLNWIETEVLDADTRVYTWIDNNLVDPYYDDKITYPSNAIKEYYDVDNSTYHYDPLIIRAKLRPDVPLQWNPQVNSGWLYSQNNEWYMYATPMSYLATPNSTTEFVLPDVAGQGAPIVVTTNETSARQLRQVHFFDWQSTPDHVNKTGLRLDNIEIVQGTGTNILYLAYPDIYNVTVVDEKTGADITPVIVNGSTNQITLPIVSSKRSTYKVSYRLRRSFYADHDYEHTDGTNRTKLVFDQSPSGYSVPSYQVTYEGDRFNTATTVDLPLSPLYSTQNDGFIFISHNEYTLDKVFVRVDPANIAADGVDYIILTITSVDQYGNPKSNQTFNLSTTWGTLDLSTIVTNNDGFAVVKLTSSAITSSLTGTVTITGGVSASVDFSITPKISESGRLFAVAKTDAIPADGFSMNSLRGRVEDVNFVGFQSVIVNWKRDRSLYSLFKDNATPEEYGSVVSDIDGYFEIGPFASKEDQSGYWFVALEAKGTISATPTTTTDGPALYAYGDGKYGEGIYGNNSQATTHEENPSAATPLSFTVGDVVFWYEYPSIWLGTETGTDLPVHSEQAHGSVRDRIDISDAQQWLSNYDETHPYNLEAQTVNINWLPPKWFAIDMYKQYQLGLLGTNFKALDITKFDDLHPPTQGL